MSIKIIGAILVMAGCGGFGWKIAAAHRREEKVLRELIGILDYMECELQYRLTPLPDLCRQAAVESKGVLRTIFLSLTQELEDQILPNVEHCVNAALAKTKNPPKAVEEGISLLGRSLGRFDIEGQLKGLETVRQECRRNLNALTYNKDVRLRSYQTLGLCAGAALAILFV